MCAFRNDGSLDESGQAEYFSELAAVDGIEGLVCNGHTGEIMSLLPKERSRVTELAAESVGPMERRPKVISGVSAEGCAEAIEHAAAAKEAGADAILLMPPHHWLRFGRSPATAVNFITDVADAAEMDVILHQYPAWTKACYSLDEMIEIAGHPHVVMIKMGTRDMSRWLYDYQRLKAAAPDVSVVTCHDEFLLPTLLESADGALIGFAGFAPRLLVGLVHAALDGDLAEARRYQQQVAPLARLIYNFGEPGCGAHQRMKTARWLLGRFPTPHFRRPLDPLSEAEVDQMRATLAAIAPEL